MDSDLREQSQGVSDLTLETRACLLDPVKRFFVTTGFVQGIYNIQIGPFRIRRIRESLDESPVGSHRFIGPLKSIVGAGRETKSVARTHAVGKLFQNTLEVFQCLVVF